MREGARAQQQQDAGTDRCSGVVRAQHPYQIASDAAGTDRRQRQRHQMQHHAFISDRFSRRQSSV